MKLSITIETNDAAASEAPLHEATRILSNIIERINNGQTDGIARDTNGVNVGDWYFEWGEDSDSI
jgi:hypothetical protein